MDRAAREPLPKELERIRWREALETLGAENVENILDGITGDNLGLGTEVRNIVETEPHPSRRFVLAWLAGKSTKDEKSTKTIGWIDTVLLLVATSSLACAGAAGLIYLAVFQY